MPQDKCQISGEFVSAEYAADLLTTHVISDHKKLAGMSVRRLTHPETRESLLLIEGGNGQYLTVS